MLRPRAGELARYLGAFPTYAGEPGMLENALSFRVVAPVAPWSGTISASMESPIFTVPLPFSTVKVMGARSTPTTSPTSWTRTATVPPSGSSPTQQGQTALQVHTSSIRPSSWYAILDLLLRWRLTTYR